MSYDELLSELEACQNETNHIVRAVSEKAYQQQFHSDLSPLGWHLGHCVFTETYWIREQLLNQPILDDALKSLYIPELSNKIKRGAALPIKEELLKWTVETQSKNRLLLEQSIKDQNTHHLLNDSFLLYFLIQHYSQHIETMNMVLTEQQLCSDDFQYTPENILASHELNKENINIPAGTYTIGSNNKHSTYDNEQPANQVTLDNYSITTTSVSNAEYLSFIEAGGYLNNEYWSGLGWDWCQKNKITHPHHWRQHSENGWFGIHHEGPYTLKETDPIHGLSHYEASAFAKWAGARLPHEYEWEVANIKNLLQTSSTWEWCNNTFHPYPEFKAYPYEGYSAPYFNEQHFVLRGASRYTKSIIKRSTFRNYYTADKRHQFAGIRLVFN